MWHAVYSVVPKLAVQGFDTSPLQKRLAESNAGLQPEVCLSQSRPHPPFQ